MAAARRLVERPRWQCAYGTASSVRTAMLVVSTTVPATRAGNATHCILRKHSGDCTKAEERGECKSEREFHDVGSVIRLRTPQPMHLVIWRLRGLR